MVMYFPSTLTNNQISGKVYAHVSSRVQNKQPICDKIAHILHKHVSEKMIH